MMIDKPKSLQLPVEEYSADKIDHIRIEDGHISIYLKNNKYIEMRAAMDIHEQGIKPFLKIDRLYWGKILQEGK